MQKSREAELVEIIRDGIGKMVAGTATKDDREILDSAQRERVERMMPAPFRSSAQRDAARRARANMNTANY